MASKNLKLFSIFTHFGKCLPTSCGSKQTFHLWYLLGSTGRRLLREKVFHVQVPWLNETSRDRPKSAPYPRLKNSKKTSKCQVFSFTVLENRKFFGKNFEKITYSKKWTERRAKVSQCQKPERGDPLRFFNIHSVAKHEKIEENKTFHFREKILQCQKKLKGGTL